MGIAGEDPPDVRRSPSDDALLHIFYTIPRAGAVRLSDGGGPFGFDITVALQVDFLVQVYDCDAIVETGCFLGDTTEFLARCYPNLPIATCDIIPEYSSFTRSRLRSLHNVTVLTGDSGALLAQVIAEFRRPFVYLDAHWYGRWPLHDELVSIRRGIVCVDDFDIGHPRFGYDSYAGERCDARAVRRAIPALDELFVGNPSADYPFPCLQVGRRAGRAYLPCGLGAEPLAASPMFVRVPLQPVITLPTWADDAPIPANLGRIMHAPAQ